MKKYIIGTLLTITVLSLQAADKTVTNETQKKIIALLQAEAENRWINEPIITSPCCTCTREDMEDCITCSSGCIFAGTACYISSASNASPWLQYIITTAGHVVGSHYIAKEFQAWHRKQAPTAHCMVEQKENILKKSE